MSSVADSEPGRMEAHEFAELQDQLQEQGIRVCLSDGSECPDGALMHDRAAVIPTMTISPKDEREVQIILRTLKRLKLYEQVEVSVKSGGHGYFNGATCNDIMIDLSLMDKRKIQSDILDVEPGCVLGQTIHVLHESQRVVPHGDCFGVGVGGHFLTAGWDILLTRLYGLGCQAVIGGRIVLWDGTIMEVDENNHPDVLHTMRGGAAAGIGIVTKVRLRLEQEPAQVTWCFASISRKQLQGILVPKCTFSRAMALPKDISVSFRFYYEPGQAFPTCSFNVVSLLSIGDTRARIVGDLGPEAASLIFNGQWQQGSVLDFRMLPATQSLIDNPDELRDMTPHKLHNNPHEFWQTKWCAREMGRSYQACVSQWVKTHCESMFLCLYAAFESAQGSPCRERMSALVILGGGKMREKDCAMPLGHALARFEQHWDTPEEEQPCRAITKQVCDIIEEYKDSTPGRPYRGDIWLLDQADDEALDRTLRKYDTRQVVDGRALSN
ncbi:uncharacterized protein F5Z01DRAFT_668886 [Emericellopsis atlantica]|uniref:FAD-binding PCMH-type domain-containing protein n=1 Tax=Emericellopsis atlantica TaxID=2614577 RepID=A0A9P7ZCJ1_9HYPO|nr:uncharacterized protein F5Z01DRAFT_668886 [Emericellopsis atlantica]KAG9249574.1 hypothetical protein F5Z01DRAFT_668886 [Emericellopsis atlantica]